MKYGRFVLFSLILMSVVAYAGYKPVTSRAPKPGEIPVTEPGNCDREGASYILTRDISSPVSALFAAKDVSIDLNGYTLTYAAGYKGVPNCGFEDGLQGWDLSEAPDAKVRDMTMLHPMVGKNICILPQGQEIVSPYVRLPVANRAYYAMVAVAKRDMRVGVFVEDRKGEQVKCVFRFGDSQRPCCPEPERAPKLGGGVVFALMFGQPAGAYRIRVKAVNRDCIIDEVDIRPAMDVGIGMVENTLPWAYYKCILDGDGCAFFDYNDPTANGRPIQTIPRVTGQGKVTIQNGVIRLGSKAIRTWGVQSTAKGVQVVLDNVKFETTGINTYAVSALNGAMEDCRTEINTPWIIDRHRQQDYSVYLGGGEVRDCDFMGGQGQLSIHGPNSKVFNNLFVNRQTVVNHYSLSVGGTGTRVWKNRFLPERGAGILIGRSQGLEIFENEFRIAASPPVNEYSKSDYSVSAIRLTDYNASKDSPKGYCGGNRIHHNRMQIFGRSFAGADPHYRPMAYGIFMSVGGDQNFVYDNDITVIQQDGVNDDKHGAYAIYVGGSNQGGVYSRNRITANTTPVWVGNMYGPADHVTFIGNHFIRAQGASAFTPFRLGHYKFPTKKVGFYSNTFEGLKFGVDINDYTTGYQSAFQFGWTLKVKAPPNTPVTILNKDGQEVLREKCGMDGTLTTPLPAYQAVGQGRVLEKGKRELKLHKTDTSSYTVRVNGRDKKITLSRDMELVF